MLAQNATQPAAFQVPKQANYNKLRPGDHLNFQILEDEGPPVELIVNTDGLVEVPYLGDIPAAGLTAEALSALVKVQLEKNFYNCATVRISLRDRPDKSSNRGRIFISGQVHRVGMVEIDKSEPNTVGKVILTNGGLSDFADARKIKIYRTTAAGQVQSLVVDLHEVLEKGRIDLDVPIYDGDLVVVGSKLVNW
jgi:polysaccharide export outer membrane protein